MSELRTQIFCIGTSLGPQYKFVGVHGPTSHKLLLMLISRYDILSCAFGEILNSVLTLGKTGWILVVGHGDTTEKTKISHT